VSAPKRLRGLYGTDVSAQLKKMGIRAHISGPGFGEHEVAKLSPEEVTAAKNLMRRVDQLRADPGFRRARNVVMDCRARDFRDFNLDDVLTMFVCFALVPQGVSAETVQRLFTFSTGKSWKALKGFPARLKKMAGQIETVNAGPFFDPLNLTARTVTGRALRAQLPLLPVTLRAYAAFLELLISKLPPLISNYFAPGKPQRGHSAWILHISNFVKKLTGRFRDVEVSDLLNAADPILDSDRTQPRFEPQTLADLRFRGKHRLRRT
jgi:hypothetical protein